MVTAFRCLSGARLINSVRLVFPDLSGLRDVFIKHAIQVVTA